MFYSSLTGGFYSPAIHGENMPPDVVEISDEEHAALLAGNAAGKFIVADSAGRPVLIDPPPPTDEQLAAARRAEILAQLSAIDAASARPLRAILVGTATDADRDRLTELDKQAAALRAELAALPA